MIFLLDKNLEKIPFKTFTEENTENPILLLQQNEIAVIEREYKLENAKFLPDLSAGYFNQQIEGVKNFSGFERWYSKP